MDNTETLAIDKASNHQAINNNTVAINNNTMGINNNIMGLCK